MEESKKVMLKKSPEAGFYRYLALYFLVAAIVILVPLSSASGKSLSRFLPIYLGAGGGLFAFLFAFSLFFAIKFHKFVSLDISHMQEAVPHAPEIRRHKIGVKFMVLMMVDGKEKEVTTARAFTPYPWIYRYSFQDFNEKKCLVAYDPKNDKAVILKIAD